MHLGLEYLSFTYIFNVSNWAAIRKLVSYVYIFTVWNFYLKCFNEMVYYPDHPFFWSSRLAE